MTDNDPLTPRVTGGGRSFWMVNLFVDPENMPVYEAQSYVDSDQIRVTLRFETEVNSINLSGTPLAISTLLRELLYAAEHPRPAKA